jgi:hypothetical protein
VEGRRKSPSQGGTDTLSTGICNVLLCFITSYRPVLNYSRFTDVSTPTLSENKHSAKNEACISFLGYGFKSHLGHCFFLLPLLIIIKTFEEYETFLVIGLNFPWDVMHVFCYLPLIHITITSSLWGLCNWPSP